VTETGATKDPDFVWPILADSYSAIEGAWRELLGAEVDGSSARPDRENAPNSLRSSVLVVGQMSEVLAASAIGGHLETPLLTTLSQSIS
jgi:hypothetical protein